MERMPVVEGLLKYIDEGTIPFYMPGHKNNRREFEELETIQRYLYSMDNTEIPGLDNMHMPGDMIQRAEDMAARAYGAAKSFFLINGSTSGIYSMIIGLLKPSDKVILQRNCHRSVFMACMMGDIDCIYVNPTILEGFNIAVSIDIQEIIRVMDANPDTKAVVITYPTYYGTCCDLEKIIAEAHKRGIMVLVDEAHGAHLPFNSRLPHNSMALGADVAVTSLHKTMPALTQTALLNVREGINTDGIGFMLRLFQSTSPSYVLMASMDAARYIMESRGKVLLDELLDAIREFKAKMMPLKHYSILGYEDMNKGNIKSLDETKIVINSSLGGKELDHILRKKYGIQVEMSDAYNIVMLCSVGDTREVFDTVYEALCDIPQGPVKGKIEDFKVPQYNRAIGMRKAFYCPRQKVKIKDAEGRISADIVSPYPPGIPVLLPGEIITREVMDAIEFYRARGIDINGLDDSKAEYINIVVG